MLKKCFVKERGVKRRRQSSSETTLREGKWFAAFDSSQGVNAPATAASKHQGEVGRPGVGKRRAQPHPEELLKGQPGAP